MRRLTKNKLAQGRSARQCKPRGEVLEGRMMLSTMTLLGPYDVDGNGWVEPLDALLVVNAINERGGQFESDSRLDVTGDRRVNQADFDAVAAALDAIQARLNYLRNQPAGPLPLDQGEGESNDDVVLAFGGGEGEGSSSGSGGGGGCQSASIDVITYSTLFVNEDDDDDDDVADVIPSPVGVEDDELEVVYVFADAGTCNLANMQVEIIVSGTIRLWTSKSKDTEIPGGAPFAANQLPLMYVEGTAEGGGTITARLLHASETVAEDYFVVDVIVALWRLSEVGLFLPLPTEVWVGEQIDLIVSAPNLITVHWLDISDNDAIKAYEQTTDVGRVHHLGTADRESASIVFYWVQAGRKRIAARITRDDPTFGLKDVMQHAKFDVKRPEGVTFTAHHDKVYIYKDFLREGLPRTWRVELGKIWDWREDTIIGIKFELGENPVPDSTLFLRQTVHQSLHALAESGRPVRFAQNGKTLLDHGLEYPGVTDNPSRNLTRSSVDLGEQIETYRGRTDFAMYLMWQSAKDNSIPVPLRRLDWFYSFGVTHSLVDGEENWDGEGSPAADGDLGSADWTALPLWAGLDDPSDPPEYDD